MYLLNTVNSAVGHHDTDEASGQLRRHGTIIIGSVIAEKCCIGRELKKSLINRGFHGESCDKQHAVV
jgi:hypothetical protein